MVDFMNRELSLSIELPSPWYALSLGVMCFWIMDKSSLVIPDFWCMSLGLFDQGGKGVDILEWGLPGDDSHGQCFYDKLCILLRSLPCVSMIHRLWEVHSLQWTFSCTSLGVGGWLLPWGGCGGWFSWTGFLCCVLHLGDVPWYRLAGDLGRSGSMGLRGLGMWRLSEPWYTCRLGCIKVTTIKVLSLKSYQRASLGDSMTYSLKTEDMKGVNCLQVLERDERGNNSDEKVIIDNNRNYNKVNRQILNNNFSRDAYIWSHDASRELGHKASVQSTFAQRPFYKEHVYEIQRLKQKKSLKTSKHL